MCATTDLFILQEDIDVLFGLLINELKTHLLNNDMLQGRSEGPVRVNTIDVTEISNSWKKIKSSYQEKCQETSVKSLRERITYFNNLLNFCNKILWKLHKDFEIFRFKIVLIFFGDDFGKVSEKVVLDLRNVSPLNEDFVMVGAYRGCLLLYLSFIVSHLYFSWG